MKVNANMFWKKFVIIMNWFYIKRSYIGKFMGLTILISPNYIIIKTAIVIGNENFKSIAVLINI